MRTISPFPSRRAARRVLGLCLLLAALVSSGCNFYRSLGKGQHLEPARSAPHHDLPKGGEEIVVQVTTDASGAVADVQFIKRSKSEAVTNYVLQTLRDEWPPTPSTRSVARLQHTSNGGFSQPEIISSEPVGAPVPPTQ